MRWGIVGCGLIGQKRAAALRALGHEIVLVSDVVQERAASLARSTDAEIAADWKMLTECSEVEAIVVATLHQWLSPIAVAGLDRGKHVLVEKPAGRNLAEVRCYCDGCRTQFRHDQGRLQSPFPPGDQKSS